MSSIWKSFREERTSVLAWSFLRIEIGWSYSAVCTGAGIGLCLIVAYDLLVALLK